MIRHPTDSRNCVEPRLPPPIDPGLFWRIIGPGRTIERFSMVNPETWRADADGHLSAVVSGLRLVVHKFESCARYVILQRAGNDRSTSEIMLSSGTEPGIEAATAAAERVAARINLTLTERRPVNDPHGQQAHRQLVPSKWPVASMSSSLKMNRSSSRPYRARSNHSTA